MSHFILKSYSQRALKHHKKIGTDKFSCTLGGLHLNAAVLKQDLKERNIEERDTKSIRPRNEIVLGKKVKIRF